MKKRVIAMMIAIVLMFSGISISGINETKVYAATELTAEQIQSYCNSLVGTSYPANLCLSFVADVFKNLGAARSSACCAHNYGSQYLVSTSSDNIPVGADVFFTGSSITCSNCGNKCGHIAIYVGDGYIVHSYGGYIHKDKLSTVMNWSNYSYRGWGYHGNINIVDNSTADNTNPGSPYPVPTRTLTKGCTGDDVRWVQKFANDVLGEGIAIDGIYGNDTEWQVLYFQQQHGLSADGMAGPVTINAMLEEWRKQSNKDTTPPTISNVKISNINSTGYTVECDVADNVGVTRVAFPTWTTYNNQDDIIWHEGSLSGNHASFRLNISEHGNEAGLYMTHIYVYDAAGNQTSANAGIINIKNGYEPMQTTVYNGHIYAVFDCECSWHDAKAKCEEMGGHLATITSKEENDQIAQLCKNNLEAYYLGATDEETEEIWKWVTGESFSYTNWRSGQPDNANNEEHYLEMYQDNGTWNDFTNNNSLHRGFVLEIDSEYSPVKTAEYGNSEYELYNISMPWDAAKLYCEQHGGTLACITSEAENNVIVNLINGAEKESYFLGATDKDNEGTWNWVSGESFSYSNWFEGEPSNRSGNGTIGPENFLSIYRGSGRWNDLRAQGDTTGFILERSVIRATGISLSKTTASITEGQTFNLVSTVHPSDARNQSVAWSSSDTGIATVDGNGKVTAKKAGTAVITATTSDGGYQASCTVTVTSAVLTGKLTVNNSTASLTKEAGSQITLNASATGGKGNYTYKFSVLNVNTGAWSVLKDFSSTSSYTYALNYTGTKQFTVAVKDGEGNTVGTNRITVKVTEKRDPLTGKLTADNQTAELTKEIGSSITLKASAAGGSKSYTYKFAVQNVDTGAWSVLKDFSSTSSYTYALNYTGKKQFSVTVKDSTGKTVATNRITVNVVQPLTGKLTVNNSTSNLTKDKGSSITLKAAATGGSGSYTYKFAVQNVETGAWSVLKDYSSTSTYTYALNYAGTKLFAVTVKDSTGKTAATNRITVNVVSPLTANLKINGLSGEQTTYQGASVTLNAKALGGSGSYTYKFAVQNAETGAWSVLKDFSSTSSFTYTMNYTGTKQFVVTVKDSSGKTVSSDRVTVNVKKVTSPLSAKLLADNSIDDLTRSAGSSLVLKTTATGGSGEYTYKYSVLNVNTGIWSVIKDYSSISTYTYALNYTGEKQFVVEVKDSTGKVVETNTINVNVVK